MKKSTESGFLDQVASEKMALSLSKFQAMSTSTGSVPGRN
jgi:hypothetical protein